VTKDEIIEMAKEAGFMQHLGVICIPNIQNLEAFAKLVAAKEREACARECERMMLYPNAKQESAVHQNVWEAAKAIRARGTHD
jgi:hypothetical protein